jgi:hypothetical protein
MTNAKGKARTITLSTGEDPTLWQYGSLLEALRANVDVLASLIRVDPRPCQKDSAASSPEEAALERSILRR